jgi:hypothetical protein
MDALKRGLLCSCNKIYKKPKRKSKKAVDDLAKSLLDWLAGK